MRSCVPVCAFAVAIVVASPSAAADSLRFAPAPPWVVPAEIPASKANDDRPIEVLLHDQQIRVEGGKVVAFTRMALKILNSQGLAAGNISIAWNPDIQTITVNALEIHRGDEVIDIPGSGQTFTTMRRESNLEMATLDGQLTANIQPEGLQVGDVIVLATTEERLDPVMKNHVQFVFGNWNGTPIRKAHARVSWPADHPLRFQSVGGLPELRPRTVGDRRVVDIDMQDIEPLVAPKGAPDRFKTGRMVEATDFRSWADVAALMAPLYHDAAVIPPSGPLRIEVEKIKASSSDPLVRAKNALQLVQGRVRYVALLMGQGGYVPATAEETWSRRFGDCKAKTVLLLAILHELGIDAVPVLVSAGGGDGLAERLPMVAQFNHVLVRARIDGGHYWLDGTRIGDGDLEQIVTPAFGWGLPVTPSAALVRIMPPPATEPQQLTTMEIDARRGARSQAPTRIETLFRGDSARALNAILSQTSAAQKDQTLRAYWKDHYSDVTVTTTSSAFDETKAELALSLTGTMEMDWDGGYFHVPNSSVGYEPDFERTAGPFRDAPYAVGYPMYWKSVTTVRLPNGFMHGQTPKTGTIDETLAGTEYHRSAAANDDIMIVTTSGRTMVPEISHATALAAEPRLRALANEDVSLRMPAGYRLTEGDIAAAIKDRPGSAQAFIDRGLIFLDSGKFDEAIDDFSQAIALDPKNAWALADRGIAYASKQDFANAEPDLEAAEAIDPDNAVVFRARGLIAEFRDDFKAAVAAYSMSLQSQPNSAFALLHRATAYRRLGEDDKALADTDAAIKAGYDSTELRLLRANIHVANGQRNAAASEARILVQQHLDDSFALVAAGRIFDRLGLDKESMAAFDKALAIKPEAYIYLNRAQSRPMTDYAPRMQDIDLALKLEPELAEALAEKAEQLAATGRGAEALSYYDRAIAEKPESDFLRRRRAVLLYKLGRVSDAEKVLAEQRRSATTASQLNSLCWAKASAGILLPSALEDCDDSLALDANRGATIDSRAMVLLRLGRLDEALSAYDQAVAKKAGAASLMGRAIVHARKGGMQAAAGDRAEAIKLDPDIVTRFAEYGLTLSDQNSITSQ